MTIKTAYIPATYAADGITTAFTVPWQYQFASDLVVQTVVVSSGIVKLLVLGSDYTVTPPINSPADTGTVLLSGALSSGTDLTISRSTPLTQNSHWVPNFSNPANLYEDAADKLTLIEQEQTYALSLTGSGGGANTVTTAIFTTAAVSSSQTMQVKSAQGFNTNNLILVTDGAHSIIAQITSISGLSITATTINILKGNSLGGDTMAVGAAVQLTSAVSTNSVSVRDNNTPPFAPTTVTGFKFSVGSPDAAIKLYVDSVTSGIATIMAVTTDNFTISELHNTFPLDQDALVVLPHGSQTYAVLNAGSFPAGSVLKSDGTNITFGPLTGANFSNDTILPAFLSATNSPTDTQFPSYDLASGKFKWVSGTGGVPGGGNAGQFFRGDGTWSDFLNMSLSNGAFIFGNSEALNSYAGFVSQSNTTPSGFNAQVQLGVVKKGVSSWAGDKGVLNIGGAVAITQQGIVGYSQLDSANVETLQVSADPGVSGSGIIRGVNVRSKVGYFGGIFTISGPTASQTIDLANGTYQRLTSFSNNTTLTITDTSPQPTTGILYAARLTLEINAPGGFSVNWPGNITWANGASAPTLSASGINIIQLMRRQGQTQWIGWVSNGAVSGTYTDAQARTAVLQSTYFLGSAAIGWNVVGGTSVQPVIINGSITNAMLAGNIAASNLAGFPNNPNVFLNGAGGFTTPPTASIPSPNSLVITWNGTQSWTANNNYSGNNTFGSVGTNTKQTLNAAGLGAGSFCTTTLGSTDGSSYWRALDINMQDNFSTSGVPPGGMCPITITHNVKNPSSGAASSLFMTQINSSPTTAGHFNVMHVLNSYTTNSSGGTHDCLFYTSWSPNSFYTASPDPFWGVLHTWTGNFVRIGEVNYGNSWADFGMQERGGIGNVCCGIEFFPQYNGNYPKFNQYDAQWAWRIGNSGQSAPSGGSGNGRNATHYIGGLIDEDSISPGGYGLRIWGAVANPFNGATPMTNAPACAIKVSGTLHCGLDFSGYNTGITGADSTPATILAETVSGHSNLPAIMLAQGQAICLVPPTGANTGTYIVDNGTHLRATRDGGNTWTNII